MEKDTLDKFVIVKTEEQNAVEWLEVLSKRNRLLSLSDWTQLPDSGLTEENVKEWAAWRNKLRQVSQLTFTNKNDALNEIEALEKIEPIKKVKTFSRDIEATRQAVIDKLHKKCNDIQFKDLNPYEIQHLQMKLDQCVEYVIDQEKNLDNYAFLRGCFEIAKIERPDMSLDEYIKTIFDMNKKFKNNILVAENFRLTLYGKIKKCNSVKKLYELDKQIDGYRY